MKERNSPSLAQINGKNTRYIVLVHFTYTYECGTKQEMNNKKEESMGNTLREKCPYTELFWSVFSCIRTEYRKIRTRNNSVFGHFSRSDR